MRRAAVPLTLAFFVVLLACGVYALSAASRSEDLAHRSRRASLALAELEQSMVDAETGQRGFLAARDVRLLEPYDVARSEWRGHLAEVEQLTHDDATQQEQLRQLQPTLDAKWQEMAGAIRGSKSGASSAELDASLVDGKELMDRIRRDIADMQANEQQSLTERRARATAAFGWALGLLGAAALSLAPMTWALFEQRRDEQAAEALEAEQRLLRGVLAALDEGFTVHDGSGRLLFANAQAAVLFGFASPDAMPPGSIAELTRHRELVSEDGSPFPLEALPGRALLAGRPGEPVVVQCRTPGTRGVRWLHIRAQAVMSAQGQVAHVVDAFRDVTDERRDAAGHRILLHAVEQFNASLDYDATLQAVAREMVPILADWCAVDLLDGGALRRVAVAHVDPGKAALVEEIERRYPPEPEVRGSPRAVMASRQPYLFPVIPPDAARAAAKDREHLELIDRLQRHSSIVAPMVGRRGAFGALSLVTAESGRVYSEDDVAFVTALADRAALAIENARLVRELEATVTLEKAARTEAEKTARFGELLVGTVSHDLRNPLSAITAGAQLLAKAAREEPQRRIVTRVVTSAGRMRRMLDQLLDFTQIRIGQGLSLAPAPLDMEDLVRQIAEETETAHGRAIDVDVGGDTMGVWDPDRLGQVLSNLLGNAAVHGDEGRPVAIGVDGRRAEAVLVEIRNDGRIPAELLPEIFEPFRRGRSAKARGLGLGLYITREIVRAHGGDVRVTSDDGVTAFRIDLPRVTETPRR